MDQGEKLLLIECIKNIPILWNQAEKGYYFQNKDLLWDEVANTLNKNKEEVKKTW